MRPVATRLVPTIALVAAVGLGLSACGGGGEEASGSTAASSSSTTAGTAACDFVVDEDYGQGGATPVPTIAVEQSPKVSVKESGSSYTATFSGLAPRSKDARQIVYSVAFQDEAGKSLSLSMRYVDGELLNFTAAPGGGGEAVEMKGEPSIEDDTVTGVFPKSAAKATDFKGTLWASSVTVIKSGGTEVPTPTTKFICDGTVGDLKPYTAAA